MKVIRKLSHGHLTVIDLYLLCFTVALGKERQAF